MIGSWQSGTRRYKHVQKDEIPDQVSCSSAISACSNLRGINEEKQMHCLSSNANLGSGVHVGISLVDFYGRLGELEDEELVFLQLTDKELPARNALINGYVQNYKEEEALILFQEMQIERIYPSMLASALGACAD